MENPSEDEAVDLAVAPLFTPVTIAGIALPNRVVMAPMTRRFSPCGISGPQNAAYYARRAEGGVGLIITEGTWIDAAVAGDSNDVPRFYGAQALSGWKLIIDAVHAAGGRIMPQLWHVGMQRAPGTGPNPALPSHGPSGIDRTFVSVASPMTQADIDATIDAYARSAVAAKRLGCDGIELHAAHGYLIDQFFWSRTNRRADCYGGTLRQRTRFAVEIVKEIKQRAGDDFPVALRFSQWKYGDYAVKLFSQPADLETFLAPLTDAGVDIFHASTRRYWDAAFEGTDLGLAGWAKKLTGKATIAVGSVGLSAAFNPKASIKSGDLNQSAVSRSTDELVRRIDRGDFDLIAVGRTLLVNPDWPTLVRTGRSDRLLPYDIRARDALS
jgi:2,4-dienoyl-CoA reductase-like NADH-dependent reductase (Old Yellow Enzyme family)